jgi:hypothetical protein
MQKEREKNGIETDRCTEARARTSIASFVAFFLFSPPFLCMIEVCTAFNPPPFAYG